jgi:hypothetical protein
VASLETNGIIAFAKAFDPSVVVTATTGGTHVSDSYHFRQGTNGEGLAVDFDFIKDKAAKRLALAQHFLAVTPKLAELFYTPLGESVKHGAIQGFTVTGHNDHVHVAVEKGTFLSDSPEPTQPSQQEDPDMPTPHSCIAPSGLGWWQLNPDGSVETHTFDPKGRIAFHGSMFEYPDERVRINPKTGKPRVWTTIQAVGAHDEDGYFVFADDGFCGKLKK